MTPLFFVGIATHIHTLPATLCNLIPFFPQTPPSRCASVLYPSFLYFIGPGRLASFYPSLSSFFTSQSTNLSSMGNFIWHEWARFVSISASVYLVWASYWAIFYRKYFWDFVDGTLRNPGGLQPGPSALPIVKVIVNAPVLQILLHISSLATLMVELPAPFLKGTALRRSFVPRILMLITQAVLGILIYQATNGAFYSLIAAFGYGMAMSHGEKVPEAMENKGRGEHA